MEDSGVIDLKAIHDKATAEKAELDLRAKDPLSSPPPAFTMEIPEPDEEALASMAKARKRPVYIAAGGIVAVLAILGIAIAATGSKDEPPARTAAVARDPAPAPPPAVTAIPTATQPAAPTPAPPSTGVKAPSAPAAAAIGGAKPATASRGAPASPGIKVGKGSIPTVKMQKVQSSGTGDPKH